MDSKQPSEQRFALLIDADNVSAKYIKPITEELSKYGTVTYKRIYGDWTLTLHAKWKDALLENSITPIQQFGYTQGKNATDSAMIIDAMDILYTNSVDGFCIVSSDSDFTRLASRIRESGLTVIGMGEKKTPVPFRKACDIFTTLELLLPQANGAKSNGRGKDRHDQSGHASSGQSAGPSIEEVERAVSNIITDNLNNGKATGLGEVGSRLLKRYPDFDVRSYGTNQLKKLLDEFPGVIVTKEGNSVTVELADDASGESAKETAKEAGATKLAAGEEAPKESVASVAPAAPVEHAAPNGEPEEAGDNRPGRARRRAVSARGRKAAAKGQEDTSAPSETAVASVAKPDALPVEAASDNLPKPRRARRTRAVKSEAVPAPEAKAEPEDNEASGAVKPASSASPKGRKAKAAGSKKAASPQKAENQKRVATPQKTESPERAAAAQKAANSEPERAADPQKAAAPQEAENPKRAADPQSYVLQLVTEAGAEGAELSQLAKRVRARFRSFKLRELGYSQFKGYVADLEGVRLEKRDKTLYAVAEDAANAGD